VHTRREVNRSPDVQMKYWAASMRQLECVAPFHTPPPSVVSYTFDSACMLCGALLDLCT